MRVHLRAQVTCLGGMRVGLRAQVTRGNSAHAHDEGSATIGLFPRNARRCGTQLRSLGGASKAFEPKLDFEHCLS